MQGYCVRCRAKQEMLSATRTLMKNGRRAMLGTCACCGTKMSVAGKWDGDAASEGTLADGSLVRQGGFTDAGENGPKNWVE